MHKRLHGRVLVDRHGVRRAELAPDEKHMLISSARRVRYWNYFAESGVDLINPRYEPGGIIPGACLGPDGAWALIVTAIPTVLKLVDISTREIAWSARVGRVGSTEEVANRLAISADAKRAMIWCSWGETFAWDLSNQREIRSFKANGKAISPDGSRLVSSSSRLGWNPDAKAYTRTVADSPTLWDVESGERLLSLNGHEGGVPDAVFSPCGRFVLTGSLDSTARLWEAVTGEEIWRLRSPAPVHRVAFSPDGDLVGFSSGRGVHVWNVATRTQCGTLDGHGDAITDISFGKSGDVAITASLDGTVCRWAARQDIPDDPEDFLSFQHGGE